MFFLPSVAISSAARAAIPAKMPVVIGQPMVAPCLLATICRIWLMVMSLPRGTILIISSTSLGAGMQTVPVPHLVLILPVISTTFGKSLLSASFACQDVFNLAMEPHPLTPSPRYIGERGKFYERGTVSLLDALRPSPLLDAPFCRSWMPLLGEFYLSMPRLSSSACPAFSPQWPVN